MSPKPCGLVKKILIEFPLPYKYQSKYLLPTLVCFLN